MAIDKRVKAHLLFWKYIYENTLRPNSPTPNWWTYLMGGPSAKGRWIQFGHSLLHLKIYKYLCSTSTYFSTLRMFKVVLCWATNEGIFIQLFGIRNKWYTSVLVIVLVLLSFSVLRFASGPFCKMLLALHYFDTQTFKRSTKEIYT